MAGRRKAACDLFQGNHPHRILKDLRQLLSDDQALRQRIDTIHRHPFFRQFACLLRTLSIDPLKIRKNERRIGDFADSHPTAIGRRTPQIILGDHIIIELRLHQHSPRFMKGHGAAATPLCLRVIQDRRIRLMNSIGKNATHTICIFHQHFECFKLRVPSSGIEVRRTVRIRKRHGKRMGYEMINPSHQHMIHEPFHIGYTESPAIIAKNLT